MRQPPRDLERELLRQTLLIAGIPCLVLALVLCFMPWYWAGKALLLLVVLLVTVPLVLRLQQQVLSVFLSSNHVLESISHGEAELRLTPALGVLGEHHRLLNEFARQISHQRLISTGQQVLLQKVSQHIAVGILAVDSQRHIILMNPAAEQLFQTSFEQWRGWPLEQLGVQDALTQVAPRLVKLHIGQQQKQVYLVSEQYLDQGKVHYLLFITDVQQLLYEEERQAWQKLLRVLSHEVNNSLTPICAISQGLQKQLQQNQPPDAALLSEALQVMNERAQGLNQFMKSYQQLNRLPPPEKQLLALDQLVAAVCALFSNQVKRVGPQLNVFADPAQLQQLLVNLLKNALEANEGQDTAVTVCWEQQGKLLVLTVTDQGAGIKNPDNLFVPFYSTKPHGCGIGLVLSRQIARNHGGDLQLYNRTPAQGAQSRLLLPL